MNQGINIRVRNDQTGPSQTTYIRLVALWVLAETMLGGLLHGFKVPASGLLVGGMAVICICFISRFFPNKKQVMKATLIVAIFKMMLTPHAPPTAYLALFFQGALGEYFLRNKRFFSIRVILFSAICLVESSIQRIIILVLVYGTAMGKAIDIFASKVTDQQILSHATYILGTLYILLHLIVGIGIGFYIQSFLRKYLKGDFESLKLTSRVTDEFLVATRSHNRISRFMIFAWVILSLLLIQSTIYPKNPWLPKGEIAAVFFRSAIILTTWFTLISPLISKLLFNNLHQKRKDLLPLLHDVNQAMPSIRYLIQESWKIASLETRRRNKATLFFKILTVNILTE